MYPYFREFEKGGLHTTIGGKPIVNFSSNDYLGLTNHPDVKAASIKAVEKYACGLSSSRVQATTVEHVELERRLAKWFGFPKCLMFTTGYQAMLGTPASFADKDTTSSSTASATPASSTAPSSPRASPGAPRRSGSSTTTR
ncbi:MAG: aminotransferase class I/II-fold pyridoxal phosphate-dependent enzyme [Polyangiaceae bacterium]